MSEPIRTWDELHDMNLRKDIEIDNLHERIRKLETAFEAQSEHIVYDDLDSYAEELPV